jgi:hypothetical protein
MEAHWFKIDRLIGKYLAMLKSYISIIIWIYNTRSDKVEKLHFF